MTGGRLGATHPHDGKLSGRRFITGVGGGRSR
jgi:hypothetical protein